MVAYEFRDKSEEGETIARYEADAVWELVELLAELRAPVPIPDDPECPVLEIGEYA